MDLHDLITALEKQDPSIVVKHGFHNPHSWRGIYSELAFEPTENISVGDMLAAAKSALGTTYEGWKGGDFVMQGYTEVHIANEGEGSDMALRLLVQSFANRSAALSAPVGGDVAGQADEALMDAVAELLEVATLRGDNELPHPGDDPKTWTSRMQAAWHGLADAYQAALPTAPLTEKGAGTHA
ncbi:hypothetical protein [Hymenobacter ruber]